MNKQDDHWLVRPTTIRMLWIAFSILLSFTLLGEIAFDVKGHFGLDDWPGFAAVFGFAVCVALVLLSKALGYIVKRDETYYDDGDGQ